MNSRILALVLALTATCHADEASDRAAFKAFKIKYGKVYSDASEEATRFDNFRDFLRRARVQQEEDEGTAEYGVTQFSDMSEAEFNSLYRRPRRPSLVNAEGKRDFQCDPDLCAASVRYPELCDQTPDDTESFDWVDYGAVTEIKNQGNCGDCFAFGGAGDLEGTHFLAGNNLTSLSAQQITSCDRHCTANGTYLGCDGGCGLGGAYELVTFDYVLENGGIASEADYPFTNGDSYLRSDDCIADKEATVTAKITGYCQVSAERSGYSVDEDLLALTLLRNGPIAIAINSGWMDSYRKGIASPKSCRSSDLDHQVLITGYGEEDGTPYWTIKNSWDSTWGEDGFCRIVRGSNKCGVASDATHSIV